MRITGKIPLDKEGQFCILCFSGPIERILKENRTYYACHACGKVSERCVVIDNGVTWWVDVGGTYWHESVGVVVQNEEREILCLFRSIYPFAYSIPAGHLDAGEAPEKAALRELKEETGFSPSTRLELIGELDLHGDSCRRGSDDHRWHLYKTHIAGTLKLRLNDEASRAEWLTVDKIRALDNATYALRYIVDTFAHVF